eukprot:m.150662 g.150662  ORF g.150662 m.150662 type:complete len:300 (-) comp15029_c0_seq2:2512-3411(-)
MTDYKEVVQSLKPELLTCKEKWPDEIKVKTGKSKEDPFPISLQRKVPQPETANHWDIDELSILLSVDGPKKIPAAPESNGTRELAVGSLNWHAECKQDNIPAPLQAKISMSVAKMWDKELKKLEPTSKAWKFDKIFDWVEMKFQELLTLEASCIEQYEGTDEHGRSIRRYTLVDKVEGKEAEESESDDTDSDEEPESNLDPEEAARRAEVIAKKRAEQEAQRLEEERQREIEAWKKRMDAEAGRGEQKFVPMSKKEQEAIRAAKNKQGVKMAKTGPRRKKYDGPGSKVEREEKEKKKGK